MQSQKREAAIGIRTLPEIRDGLFKAAEDQDRSISWLVEKICREWLEANGYVSAKDRAVPVRHRERAARSAA